MFTRRSWTLDGDESADHERFTFTLSHTSTQRFILEFYLCAALLWEATPEVRLWLAIIHLSISLFLEKQRYNPLPSVAKQNCMRYVD